MVEDAREREEGRKSAVENAREDPGDADLLTTMMIFLQEILHDLTLTCFKPEFLTHQ